MAGTEDPRIPPRTERPQELSHAKIIEGFDPVGVDPSFGATSVFWQAKIDWEVGLYTFRQRMNAAISEAWEGNAAETSKQAIAAYTTKAQELTPTFETVARLISSSALAAADTKSAIPPRKDDPKLWHINDRWINNDEFEDGRSDDEEQARAIMKTKYVEAFATVDAGLPVLDHPTSLVAPDSFVPGGNGNGGGGDNNSGGGGGDTSENPSTIEDENSAAPSEDETTTEDDSTNQNSEDQDTSTTEDDDTSEQDTNPANTDSPATTPTTTTPGTGTPNTPGSPGSPSGSPSGGSPAGGAPGASVPAPGRTVPGVPSTVVPVATAAGIAAGAGGRGMMGAPGMMGAGAGRGSGNDDESIHETPDYLVNEANTRELIGDIPKVAPQAIGSHFPSAQNRPTDGADESS
ncbi:hypothetical protein AB0I35_25335 [Nocardia sp. NPDC050378]|uniref:hypothetical protein n=1 Tax=Nocardia sp. NPDC050378 TaxID=3155400 RepID=UPI0033CC47E7